MDTWPEDLSKNTLEEVIGYEAMNAESSRNLRIRSKAIVNSKLTGTISREEYLVGRMQTAEEVAECKRRRSLLILELAIRGYQC